jgi:dephospho-CoA kinase
MPFVVALTGGIGSGKSTVADLLQQQGATVVDTDVIARDLTTPGTTEFKAIIDQFGKEVLGDDGELAMDALRAKVFSDSSARLQLERILHPPIRAEAMRRAMSSNGPYVVLVVPLLVEKGGYEFVDRTLVVDCAPQLQVERVTRRSGLDSEQAQAIIRAQATREDRLSKADDVLVNEGSLDALTKQVEGLHRRYLAMSQASD